MSLLDEVGKVMGLEEGVVSTLSIKVAIHVQGIGLSEAEMISTNGRFVEAVKASVGFTPPPVHKSIRMRILGDDKPQEGIQLTWREPKSYVCTVCGKRHRTGVECRRKVLEEIEREERLSGRQPEFELLSLDDSFHFLELFDDEEEALEVSRVLE